MKIAMIDLHNAYYKPMADMTLPGKMRYAEKHGYEFFCKTDNFVPDVNIGFQKCFWLSELMEQRPDIEWFWHSGTDCLLTNHNIKLESLIDNEFHFIVAKDDHGICADIFFIRNTPEGREYMKHLQEPHPMFTEQGHMWDDEFNLKWKCITKYLPQYTMNSYAGQWYPHKRGTDKLGQRGFWQSGDLLVHAVTGMLLHLTPDEIFQWKLDIIRNHTPHVIN